MDKVYAERPCGRCGTIFTPTNGPSKYCSDDCRLKMKRQQARDSARHRNTSGDMSKPKPLKRLKRYRHRCLVCGKWFLSYGIGNHVCPKRMCQRRRNGMPPRGMFDEDDLHTGGESDDE